MKHIGRPLLALILLGAAGAFTLSRIDLDYRIDAFLPAPHSADQQIVADQIAGGAAGRLILAAVDGDSAPDLAATSRELARSWNQVNGVERVDNGDIAGQPDLLDPLMLARFVLLDGAPARLEPEALAAALADRRADLAAAGHRIEALVARDPLGLIEALGEHMAGQQPIDQLDGVWVDAGRALLVVQSALPPYAVESQARLLDDLRAAFEAIAGPDQRLQLSGAPVIGVASAEASRSDAIRLSLWGSALLLLVLSFAWRSASAILAGAVPLAAGVVGGLLVTALVFGSVHGLTLAFGFTLLGVALDYPIHLFGHADHRALSATARSVRSTLLLSVSSTLIAYLAIAVSSSPGLAQLGTFSAAGLAAAALATMFLPRLDPVLPRRPHSIHFGMRHWPVLPMVLAGAALAVLVWQGEARWSADLSRLSPIDPAQVAVDRDLRDTIGAGELRYLIAVEGDSLEAVLTGSEAAVAELEQARQRGWIDAWRSPGDLLPSARRQRERLASWPAADELRTRLANTESGFRPDAFEPFLSDLQQARAHGPINRDFWAGSPFETRLDSLLDEGPDGWRALIEPVGLSDPEQLDRWLNNSASPARLVDLAAGSEAMVAAWRQEVGVSLAIAAVLIVVLLWFRLGRLREGFAVLLPPTAAVLVTAAGMSLFDGGLSIAHLVGLLLVTGIGLDFTLFARRFRADPQIAARTRRAINTCALTTGAVFLVLAWSQIGLLQMLGLTVAVGILLSWLFSRFGQPR